MWREAEGPGLSHLRKDCFEGTWHLPLMAYVGVIEEMEPGCSQWCRVIVNRHMLKWGLQKKISPPGWLSSDCPERQCRLCSWRFSKFTWSDLTASSTLSRMFPEVPSSLNNSEIIGSFSYANISLGGICICQAVASLLRTTGGFSSSCVLLWKAETRLLFLYLCVIVPSCSRYASTWEKFWLFNF